MRTLLYTSNKPRKSLSDIANHQACSEKPGIFNQAFRWWWLLGLVAFVVMFAISIRMTPQQKAEHREQLKILNFLADLPAKLASSATWLWADETIFKKVATEDKLIGTGRHSAFSDDDRLEGYVFIGDNTFLMKRPIFEGEANPSLKDDPMYVDDTLYGLNRNDAINVCKKRGHRLTTYAELRLAYDLQRLEVVRQKNKATGVKDKAMKVFFKRKRLLAMEFDKDHEEWTSTVKQGWIGSGFRLFSVQSIGDDPWFETSDYASPSLVIRCAYTLPKKAK